MYAEYKSGSGKYEISRSTVPYTLFSNSHPFLRDYDEDMWQHSNYSKWTETRFFEHDQVQECMISSFSDNKWDLTVENENQMKQDLAKAINEQNNTLAALQLQIDYEFTRAQPDTARESKMKVEKDFDYSYLDDCLMGL